MNTPNYVQEYIDKIRSGEILVCRRIEQAYFNIIEPVIKDEHPKYGFDAEAGNLFVEFAETYCKNPSSDWIGKPIRLMLFQKAKYQALFGIYERSTGKLRFEEVFDVRGRKNGKSTENAILGLYSVLQEDGAEVYVAATTHAQAKRVWDDAREIRNQSRSMVELLGSKVFPAPTIYKKNGKSYFTVLSSKVNMQDGLNVKVAIVDECHELPRSRYDIMKQAMSSRDNTLMSMISTAGFVREALYDDIYDYMCKVLDGSIEDDKVLPLLYELDDPNEIEDEKCWIKANPSLGVIKKVDKLRYLVDRMKAEPNLANTVKTKDFNIRGIDEQAWLKYDDYDIYKYEDVPGSDRKVKKQIVYTEDELRKYDNTYVLGGFDLSKTNDLTAFVTLLFDKENHRIIAVPMFWMTAKFFQEEAERNSKIPWKSWIDRGLIRISGVEMIDYHDIANYVASNFKTHGWMYQFINYDSWSAPYLVQELAQMGYMEGYCLLATQQGYKTLSVPMQLVQAHLKERVLCYNNNPVLKWMFSNVILTKDRNGNFMPDKSKRMNKIDGVAALLNCYVSLAKNPDDYMISR